MAVCCYEVRINNQLKSISKPHEEQQRDELFNVIIYILANQVTIIKKFFCMGQEQNCIVQDKIVISMIDKYLPKHLIMQKTITVFLIFCFFTCTIYGYSKTFAEVKP